MAEDTPSNPQPPQSFVRKRASGEGKMVKVGSAPKPKGAGRAVSRRDRGTDTRVKGLGTGQRKATQPITTRQFASAGKYTQVDGDTITESMLGRGGRMGGSGLSSYQGIASMAKQANFLGQSDLGPANIADSDNIGYYSFEFPVDALMLPASRPEEIRYYRLAYDRDPIVAAAIDLNTDIPMSKMILEKPKSGDDEFADYVFDWFGTREPH